MDPLARPEHTSPTLALFRRHFCLADHLSDWDLLEEGATAFSTIPYENLTKIIRNEEIGGQRAKRVPADVIGEHVEFGGGGTCFSLTAAMLHILRALGWRAEPILADRHYGMDTHCALVVWIDERPHLLDPGYLIVRPIPLGTSQETHVATSFNAVILRPTERGERYELYTSQQVSVSHRLTLKVAPTDPGTFLRAWDASFDWDMMRYPVLTRAYRNEHIYLQGQRIQRRGREHVVRDEIDLEQMPQQIAQEFGVDVRVVRRALEILQWKGELHGDTHAR